MQLKSRIQPLCASPISAAFWIFVVVYLFAVLYVRHITYLDPGSLFFNPTLAYTRRYSEVRRQQADEYIRSATKATFPKLLRPSSRSPDLCVGVAGLIDDPARYLETNIGSLLEGLTGDERDRIHVSVFLAHRRDKAAVDIPPHFEPWINKLVDEVKLYKLSDSAAEPSAQSSPNDRPYYTDLMKSCYASGAPYMAIFEDETVAMDGWFHRTMAAIDQAEALSTVDGNISQDCKLFLI